MMSEATDAEPPFFLRFFFSFGELSEAPDPKRKKVAPFRVIRFTSDFFTQSFFFPVCFMPPNNIFGAKLEPVEELKFGKTAAHFHKLELVFFGKT